MFNICFVGLECGWKTFDSPRSWKSSDFAPALQALLLPALFKRTNDKCSFPTRIKLELLKDLSLVPLHPVALPLRQAVCHSGNRWWREGTVFQFGEEGHWEKTGNYLNILRLWGTPLSLFPTGGLPAPKTKVTGPFCILLRVKTLLLPVNQDFDLLRKIIQRL